MLIIAGISLPETARNVVGNGDLEAKGWSRTWWTLMKHRKHVGRRPNEHRAAEQGDEHNEVQRSSYNTKEAMKRKEKFKMANP